MGMFRNVAGTTEKTMRLFMFKSEGNRGLRAFAADSSVAKLPPKLGPWTAIGVVREDGEPPHNMSRETIEKTISEQGFQLYRLKNAKS
jgi:hypothetical protein